MNCQLVMTLERILLLQELPMYIGIVLFSLDWYTSTPRQLR
jgi:hypothetical protein